MKFEKVDINMSDLSLSYLTCWGQLLGLKIFDMQDHLCRAYEGSMILSLISQVVFRIQDPHVEYLLTLFSTCSRRFYSQVTAIGTCTRLIRTMWSYLTNYPRLKSWIRDGAAAGSSPDFVESLLTTVGSYPL